MNNEQYWHLHNFLKGLGWPAKNEGEKFSEHLDKLVAEFYATHPPSVEESAEGSDQRAEPIGPGIAAADAM